MTFVIIGCNDESDPTIDYVLANDDFTMLPVSADIPNPLWVDDGSQTSPDANGETRFLSQVENPNWVDDGSQTSPDADGNERYLVAGAGNIALARLYSDGEFSIANVRNIKGDVQKRFPQIDVRVHTATVGITLDPLP